MKNATKRLFCILMTLGVLMSLSPPWLLYARGENQEELSLSDPMPDNDAAMVQEVTEDVSEMISIDCAEAPADAQTEGSAYLDINPVDSVTTFTEMEDADGTSPEAPDGAANMDVASASVTLRASPASVTLPKGSSATISLTHSGYGGSVRYKYSVSSTTVFSYNWIGWSSYYTYTFRINAQQAGSGIMRMYLYSAQDVRLGSVDISITVTENKPVTLNVQPTALNMQQGAVKNFDVTYKNCPSASRLQYSISNPSVVQCELKQGASGNCSVNVRALKAGTSSVSVYLRNSLGQTLAQSTASVSVTNNLRLSVSPSSVTVAPGASASGKVSVTGSGSYRLECASSNSKAFTCSLSGSSSSGSTLTRTLLITGRATGSGYVKVSLKSSGGETLQSAQVSVTVQPKPATLTVSPSSVTAPAQIKCTLTGGTGAERIGYAISNPSLMQCTWSAWQNNTIYLNVTSKQSGTGTIKFYLIANGVQKYVSSVSVRTTLGIVKNLSDYRYSFANYSKPTISLKVCQYVFGNNQFAQQVYNWQLSKNGLCFGIAASSGLFSAGSPRVSSFSASKSAISQLSKSDYNSSLRLYLYDFIDAVHITQKSPSLTMYSANSASGIQSMIQALDGGPVLVCMMRNSTGTGHAVLAYASEQGGLKVYDPNTPYQEKKLTLSGSSWSFPFTSGSTWTNSLYSLYYVPAANYRKAWENRASSSSSAAERNLLITSAKNFSLYEFADGAFSEEPVVRYRNGVLSAKSAEIEEVLRVGVLPGMEGADDAQPVMLYVPQRYYKIVDDGGDDSSMDVSLSDEKVAVRVTTDADEFCLMADDETERAYSTLSASETGGEYKVAVYSTDEPLAKEVTVRGGSENPVEITVGLDAERGAAFISSEPAGSESAMSVAEAAAENIGDVSLSVAPEAGEPLVFVSWTEGGKIVTENLEGGNVLCRIEPDEGYVTKDVLLSEGAEAEGESLGAPTEYLFQGADDGQARFLHAEFARRAEGAWNVRLLAEKSENGVPKVEVTRKDGAESAVLEEGADYEISYEDLPGAEDMLYVTATPESGFTGVIGKAFTLGAPGGALDAGRTAYWRTEKGIRVRVAAACTGPVAAVVTVLAPNGKTIAVKTLALSESAPEQETAIESGNLPEALTVKAFLLTNLKDMTLLDDRVITNAPS